MERRTGGGDPPTAENYQRALDQWQALPGAVRMSPVLGREEPDPPKEDGNDGDEAGAPR